MPGEQLLLINPRRRRKLHKSSRRRVHRRSRVHRRARRARARKPIRRRRTRSAGGFRIRRRRHRNPRARHHRRRRNPIMRRRRHRYRNPMSSSGIKSVLVPAAVGAAGGMALDVAWNYLSPYIPSTFTSSPYLTAATKIAAAFGLGMVARKFLGRDKGNAVMAGAVTIQIYSAASMALSGTIPGLSGLRGFGAYMTPVASATMSGLGSPNPAVYLQKPGMGRMGRMGRMGAYMRPAANLSGLPFGGMGSVGSLAGQGNSFDMFDAT